MRKILNALVLCSGLVLAGCAGFQAVTGVYKTATETVVPADKVIPVAYSFDILKAAATNYGQYCIDKLMAPPICSKTTRRVVIKSVRSGTRARGQLEDSVTNKTPALASVYNVLVEAVNGLQQSPASNVQFVESVK